MTFENSLLRIGHNGLNNYTVFFYFVICSAISFVIKTAKLKTGIFIQISSR